jgi:hypothetical protein
MARKDITKIRRDGLKTATKERNLLIKKLKPISKAEELYLIKQTLKSKISRCKSDLQNPSFANNAMILYKIKNLQETLQSVENEINSLDKKE